MDHSLEVFSGDEIVFVSDLNWIYPLFDLERFLTRAPHRPADLLVVDKVVGKAAAMVLAHLCIGRIHGVMMSSLAKSFLEQRQIRHSHDELVDRILCRTEELLAPIDDPSEGYQLLKKRAKLANSAPTNGEA